MTDLSTICNTITSWLTAVSPHNPHWDQATWQTFQLACRVHGVAPLLKTKLADTDWLDDAQKNWLAEQYHFNQQRIARMQQELQAILVQFDQNNIPLMPLKGSILQSLIYPDNGVRPMADLDLLIHPDDFEAARQQLLEIGYIQDVVHWKHTEFIKPDNQKVVSPLHEHPDNPRGLELHLACRETFGGPLVDLTTLMWDRANQGEIEGARAYTPRLEMLWLHLVVHATYHFWQGKGRLIQLVDLTGLTPQVFDQTEFETTLQLVDARFTYPALALLNRYFPGVLTEQQWQSQKARVSNSFHVWATSLDLVNSSHLNPNPSGLYFSKALKFTEGRPIEVIQALRFAFLPSLEEIALDHPKLAKSRAPWLAYFLLPLDWAKRLFWK
ncbi:MAG: nucleotidyltransferase family protein [Chloroflexota bacterium]